MGKPIVFISHITEEKEMAIELKKLIEHSFLGMIDVFVSSDENSISSGSKWLDNITTALESCAIELILCSPKSVTRPWINFEAGSGWVRKIPVIPLCHSGMIPENLPIPLNLLQAVRISEISSFKLIFPVLASAVDSMCPDIAFDDFVLKMKKLEGKYMYWDKINIELKKLFDFNKDIFNKLLEDGKIDIFLSESEKNELQSCIKFILEKEYVSIENNGSGQLYANAVLRYGWHISSTQCYRELFKDKNCEFYRE